MAVDFASVHGVDFMLCLLVGLGMVRRSRDYPVCAHAGKRYPFLCSIIVSLELLFLERSVWKLSCDVEFDL